MHFSRRNMIDARIAGIPCKIHIDMCEHYPPIPTCMDSDIDYRGGYDIEFTVLDRKGYLADWLRRKMTEEEAREIERKIIAQRVSENEDAEIAEFESRSYN